MPETQENSGRVLENTLTGPVLQNFEFKNSSFAEILFLIPTFSGGDEDISIGDFLEKVEEIMSMEGWSEKHFILAIKLKMTGEAAIFANSNPTIKKATTREEVIKELRNRFDRVQDNNGILRFTQATQRINETTRSFLSRMSSLAQKCFPKDEGIRESLLFNQVLKGLRTETRKFIMGQNPKTFKDVWDAAIQEEKCLAFDKSAVEINVATNTTNTQPDITQIKHLMQINTLDTDKKIQDLTDQVNKLTMLISSQQTPQTPNTQQTQNQQFLPPPQFQPHYATPHYQPTQYQPTQFQPPQPFYPPHAQHQYRQNKQIICYACGKPGHISRVCRNKNSNNNAPLN